MKDCPKHFAIYAITAMAVAYLLVFAPPSGLALAAAPREVLGVDEFMKNVDRYQGKVKLEGVVSAVAPEQRAISLIDAKEFQACGVTSCAPLTLPVQWRGPMPAVRDPVRVEGQAQEVDGKLMFVATKLEKVIGP